MNFYSNLLNFSSPLALLLGVLCSLVYLKYLDRTSRILFVYFIWCITFDIVSRFATAYIGNNLIMWIAFNLGELVIFSALYFSLLKKRTLLGILSALGMAYLIFEIVYIDSYDVKHFQSYSKIVSSILIVIMVMVDFVSHLNSDKSISKNIQWLNSAILAYFSLVLILFLPLNLLINETSSIITYIWFSYLIVTVLFYVFISFFIWKNGRNRKWLHYGS